MSKTKKAVLAAAAVIVVAVIAALIVIFAPRNVDLSFAESIVVTDNWADGGAKSVEISSEADADSYNKLLELCSDKSPMNRLDLPACQFERYEIEFKSGNKSVTVIPSNDGCDTMLIEKNGSDTYYDVDASAKAELDSVLENLI